MLTRDTFIGIISVSHPVVKNNINFCVNSKEYSISRTGNHSKFVRHIAKTYN